MRFFRCPSQIVSFRGLSGLRSFDRVHRTLTTPVEGKAPKRCSPDEAVQEIESGEHIFLHHAMSCPTDLVKAFGRHAERNNLTGIRASHALTCGEIPWLDEKLHGRIRSTTIFVCTNFRELVNDGKADYLPVFLSQSARLYDEKVLRVDTALLNVSPPDQHGYCSLGVNVDMSSAAARNANRIIASVNKTQPRTFGDSEIHISQIDTLVEAETPIYELPKMGSTEAEKQIGKLIAENLVPNGATLQMGIGSIPNNVLEQLKGHKDLGVHSEMVSDGIVELLERNVINNSKKSMYPGRIVVSFAMGSRKFYELMDNNPLFLFASAAFTNATATIIQQSKMVAINSAIEVDFTGQVASDTIGTYLYSGFGGQLDFINGASLSNDGLGKSIIALPSRTNGGGSKIVNTLREGAGIVTTKAHCRYVVTEYGIANLWGKSVRQRAYELINIAHPDDRKQLEEQAYARFKCMPSKE